LLFTSFGQGPLAKLERQFVYDGGIAWRVWEISNPSMPEYLKALRSDRRQGGWLVFEADDGRKRRLAPYPIDWAHVSDFEIIRWCARAVLVPPAPSRRLEDK